MPEQVDLFPARALEEAPYLRVETGMDLLARREAEGGVVVEHRDQPLRIAVAREALLLRLELSAGTDEAVHEHDWVPLRLLGLGRGGRRGRQSRDRDGRQ